MTQTLPQQIYAKIKRSSKYYGQTEPNQPFPVHIVAKTNESHDGSDYIVKGGPGGQYRLADVSLFIIQSGHEQRISR